MTLDPWGRALSDFTVELDVYSGPYEWLLALILKDELEIFEVPLHELVSLYLQARNPEAPNVLERDTDFAGSAAALVLLKSRTLSPSPEDAEDAEEEAISPEQLAERLTRYLMVRRGAEALHERFAQNAGHHPSAHVLPPRSGRLRIDPDRVVEAARRSFSRPRHLRGARQEHGPPPRGRDLRRGALARPRGPREAPPVRAPGSPHPGATRVSVPSGPAGAPKASHLVEAVLLTSARPVGVGALSSATGLPEEEVGSALSDL